ncbi:MAG: xanthine dehydrogenase family protein molybdopterin-binding subunit [Janthinobacterium lividum]
MPDTHIGLPRNRVDGPAKVTGGAQYAAEYTAPGLLYGYVVSSEIATGRIKHIDSEAARALPGVIEVITHENRPRTAWLSKNYSDQVAPPGSPFRALYDDTIQFSGQPVAVVIAEDFDTARDAASLVRVDYEAKTPLFDLGTERSKAYEPSKKRSGIEPPPKPRGDAEAALDGIPVRIEAEYTIASEHHNPMEPHATTVVWNGDGSVLVHDKIQGAQAAQKYIQDVFGLKEVRVLNSYVGGAFGSALRPQYQLFLTVLAATMLERSVRITLTRDQMWTMTHRPEVISSVVIGATTDGSLQAIKHDAISMTSQYEDYQEVVVNWSGMLYECENVALTYKLAKLDTSTPGDMRAPGAPTGTFAIESAMDELAAKLEMDPVALRLKNYAEKDQNKGKPWSSKELRAAIQRGADRFGWEKRTAEPRSMREGHELIGWGMAIGAWDAQMMTTKARAVLKADGTLEVSSATADIGTGTYTILTQIGADTMGLPMDKVSVRIGDSDLPQSPIQGGSWTAASAGTAVQQACLAVRDTLFGYARKAGNSPFGNIAADRVVFRDGHIVVEADPSRSMSYAEALAAGGVSSIAEEGTGSADKLVALGMSSFTHSACFVEVRIDEDLGVLRVTRVVNAVAAGRILNPKTSRSQVLGGVVWGMGMALYEESMPDHNLGRFMNHNLGEYHIAVNADVPEVEVIFVDEHEPMNALGVKGLGEIGIVATPAAIANAVFHATGKRIRSLPITIDKIQSA